MQFETMILGVIGVIPLVTGLVEAAKKFGVEGNASFGLALGLGAAFAGYLEAVAQGVIPEAVQPFVSILVVGLAGGLAATGLYDFATGKNRE